MIKNFNPALDLKIERTVDLPPELLWKAWTTPDIIKEWFCPKPWKTVECEIDLKPGGKFYTVMQGPDGESHSSTGCFLELTENRSLVWTDAFGPGFRPSAKPNDCLNSFFTAKVSFESCEEGARYVAVVMHADPESRIKHEQMGFEKGWGVALEQLVSYMKKY